MLGQSRAGGGWAAGNGGGGGRQRHAAGRGTRRAAGLLVIDLDPDDAQRGEDRRWKSGERWRKRRGAGPASLGLKRWQIDSA